MFRFPRRKVRVVDMSNYRLKRLAELGRTIGDLDLVGASWQGPDRHCDVLAELRELCYLARQVSGEFDRAAMVHAMGESDAKKAEGG